MPVCTFCHTAGVVLNHVQEHSSFPNLVFQGSTGCVSGSMVSLIVVSCVFVWYGKGPVVSWYVRWLWHQSIRRMLTSTQSEHVGICSCLWHVASIYMLWFQSWYLELKWGISWMKKIRNKINQIEENHNFFLLSSCHDLDIVSFQLVAIEAVGGKDMVS